MNHSSICKMRIIVANSLSLPWMLLMKTIAEDQSAAKVKKTDVIMTIL